MAAVVLALVGVGAAVWQPWQDDTSTTVTAADRVLADPDAQRVTQELDNGATATVVRSPKEHRAVLVTENMPRTTGGQGLPAVAADAVGRHGVGGADARERHHRAAGG